MDTAVTFNNLWPKIEKKLPRLISIVLIILISLTLAKLVWGLFDSGVNAPAIFPSAVSTSATKPQPRPQFDRKVVQLHMMGKAVSAGAKKVENAPDTTLNLKLLGVLAGDKEFGYAIISNGGSKIKHYALGDDVPGGATLYAVYPDRVILERGMRMETLRLPKAQAARFSKKLAKTTSQQQASMNADSFYSLGQFHQEIMKNPIRLKEFINATLEKDSETGEYKGYKLSPSKYPDMFYQLGFQPGDIVTNINGVSLDHPDRGLEAMQTLVNATEITIVVMREGTEITLFHDLSQ